MIWKSISRPSELKPGLEGAIIIYGNDFPSTWGNTDDFLNKFELDEYSVMKNEAQANTRKAGRAVLRIVLGQLLGIHASEIIFDKTFYGKPYLKSAKIFFNVSHTDHAFLLAFNYIGRIGIDMEVLKGEENIDDIMDYAFSESEKKEVCDNDSFLKIWTQKEALLKATGVGLIVDLPSINRDKCISRLNMKSITFQCPGNEIASIVVNKKVYGTVGYSI